VLKQLFDLIRNSFLLSREIQENRKDVEELRRDLDKVEDSLRELALLIREERHEREKLALQLENILLRFERRLPPGPTSKPRG
jgi:hypothetical protein